MCNDTNDVVLYFGDTSAQCNKPDEGEDYTKCLSNADCCGEYFCAFENASGCSENKKGSGICKQITSYNPQTTVMSDGRIWTRSRGQINWWSAQNWCMALGLQPASRADIGCNGVYRTKCNNSSILDAIQKRWMDNYNYYWLEDAYNDCNVFYLSKLDSIIDLPMRHVYDWIYALCH